MARRPGILVLSAYYFPFQGGSETHARTLATYLAANGFEVIVVTRRVNHESPAFENVDGIPVHRVWPPGPRTGWRKWLMIPFAIVKLLELRHRFDLVYCPGYQGIGIAAIVSGKLLGRPVILRSGNLGVLRGNNWDVPLRRWHIHPDNRAVQWLKVRLQRFYMSAQAFACNCRDTEQEALACRVPPDSVHYLPNAVDVERFRPPEPGEKARVRDEHQWPADAFLCLYVGRLSMEKGVLELLEAWRAIHQEHKILVLIGPDMTEHAMDVGPLARQYVADHGMGHEVIFHGESADVARLLRAADMYVQPSRYEAFSNAVIEAMATGLPVVASRVGGMLDCIVDNDNGLFSRPLDPADLATQIVRLMADVQLRTRLGARARETVVERFGHAKIFGRFADLFVTTAAKAAR